MRTLRPLLARAATLQPAGRAPPSALLPPIPLYRRLLRAHRRCLPREMRVLGDEYVKGEFRAHREVENPMHIIGFLTEWQLYAQKLEGSSWQGEVLDKAKIDKMSDQQIGQLYELMKATRDLEGEGEGGELGGEGGEGKK
ncbi:hypothetical protein VF21_08270 [Pseudogymnoascus sp. 05NY08]|nr:hypothetical protein VF21_08270 [Pseudogymnoascus sp. 05NY08]